MEATPPLLTEKTPNIPSQKSQSFVPLMQQEGERVSRGLRRSAHTLSLTKVEGKLGVYLKFQDLDISTAQALFEQTGKVVIFKPGEPIRRNFDLGSGAFGRVYLVKDWENAFLALKETVGDKAIEQEAIIQAKLSGLPYVLPLADQGEGKTSEQKALYHFFPLAGLGSTDGLRQVLPTLDLPFREAILTHLAHNLLTGLDAIHAKGYAHLDIKPDNILINDKGEFVIADFGVTAPMQNGLINPELVGGTVSYYSPERYDKTSCSGALVDTWAVAITLVELAGGYPKDLIFTGIIYMNEDPDLKVWHQKICNDCFPQDKVPLANPAPGSIWEVIRGLIDPNPQTRLTPEEALKRLPPLSADAPQYLAEFIQHKEWIRKPSSPTQSLPLPHFTSYINRPELEKTALKTLLRDKRLVLQGMGGVGKSQLATYLIHHPDIRAHFDTFLWFEQADNPQMLDLQYLALAKEWGLVEEGALPKEAFSKLSAFLKPSDHPWLVVYDNAPHPKDLLPLEGGHILITSRLAAWKEKPHCLPIPTMESHESAALVNKLLGTSHDIEELAYKLGHHPLAIVQACAYIRKQGITLPNYLEALKKTPDTLFKANESHFGKTLPASVFSSWELSFSGLSKESSQLIDLLAYFSPDIPGSLFNKLPQSEAIDLLVELSLVEKYEPELLTDNNTVINQTPPNFSIHRITQELIRSKHKPEEAKQTVVQLMQILTSSYTRNPSETEKEQNTALIPHGEALKAHLFELNPSSEPEYRALRDTASWLGNAYKSLGNFLQRTFGIEEKEQSDRQLENYKQAAYLDYLLYPKGQHPTFVRHLDSLGSAYLKNQRFEEAVQAHQDALKIAYTCFQQPKLAPLQKKLASALKNWGANLKDASLLKKAITYFEEAAKNYPDIKEQADCYSDIAEAYSWLGDPQASIDALKEMLSRYRTYFGSTEPLVPILHNIGECYQELDQLEEGIRYLNEALDIRLKANSPPEKLASRYLALGRALKQAKKPYREMLEKALEIYQSLNCEDKAAAILEEL